jgi:hypothetical protein
MDWSIDRSPGEEGKILAEPSPVLVICLKSLLFGRLVHPVKEIHVDRLVFREQERHIILVQMCTISVGQGISLHSSAVLV